MHQIEREELRPFNVSTEQIGCVKPGFRSSKWHSDQAASPPERMQWISGL
jgi:hypothetical protein